jgi:hypothetical protein
MPRSHDVYKTWRSAVAGACSKVDLEVEVEVEVEIADPLDGVAGIEIIGVLPHGLTIVQAARR